MLLALYLLRGIVLLIYGEQQNPMIAVPISSRTRNLKCMLPDQRRTLST